MANEELASGFDLYGHRGPHMDAPVVLNLLSAYLSFASSDVLAAYRACEIAIGQLQSGVDRRGENLGADDRKYLLHRAKWLLVNLTDYADAQAFKLAASISVTYQDINLPRVSRFIRGCFPMNVEEAAALERFISENSP